MFAPDLKGFGENCDMKYPYSLDDYVSDVEEYMYKKGLDSPFVIAHSFGARVVIKGVGTKKLDFKKIVLTGPAGLKGRKSIKKGAKKLVFSVLKKVVPREKLRAFYSRDYLSLTPIMKKSFTKIVGENLDGYLSKIDCPTLVIEGLKDRETPPYMARKMNREIKNSKLIFFEGAGHFAFIDSPLKFNLEVKEFLLS